ncbi:LysR family transcriptional regulator [Enterobacter hormaechei]|nr:lysR family transcriptional regulator domain protein [Enterobacter hormaechei subsp. hoffmannii]CZX73754.1 LysR family transcriptional regulator [Enterobacter hormaechei]CZX89395.1 LysR family transcriptional regulator [Enterobacter hormaechei]SAD85936.1 LysR family transcriptional regulator [Enterobacter hormaechei]SAE15035.1 LysR family transcriptional regulator [Enterobacter hormaechei]
MYYKMATLSLCREFGVFCSQAGKSSRATQTSLEGMLKMKRSA